MFGERTRTWRSREKSEAQFLGASAPASYRPDCFARAYDSMVSVVAGYKLNRDSIDCPIRVKFVISHLVNGRFSTIDKSIREESLKDLKNPLRWYICRQSRLVSFSF